MNNIGVGKLKIVGAAVMLAAVGTGAFLIGASRGTAGSPSGAEAATVGEARASTLTVALAPAAPDRIYGGPDAAGRPIVVIDAGHGGTDPGASAVSGEVTEKTLALELARELRDLLVRRGRLRIAMTRESDTYVGLEDRAAVARRLGASLFVSLHMDSAPNPLARGASVYSLSDVASDADAQRFASSENGSAARPASSDGSVKAMLADLAVRSQMSGSADFAARLVRKSQGRISLRPEPHRFASFHVLRSVGTPAVLFEAGYISNAEDEQLLRSSEHRQAIATALAQAIEADVAAREYR